MQVPTNISVRGASRSLFTTQSFTYTGVDPVTGAPIGTLTLASNGAYIFDPVDGYIGPAPAVNVYSKDSNGQTAVSSLTIDVLPGGQVAGAMLLGFA